MIPVDVEEAQSHVQALVAYGVDIFINDGKEHIPLWKKGTGYESAGLEYMRKVAGGQVEVAVPMAVLKEDPRRQMLLQNGRVVNHSAEIVFTDVRFPVNALNPMTYQLEAPHVVAVVFDLRPGNARLISHAINVIRTASIDIRTASTNIAIFVRQDRNNPVTTAPGGHIWADEYLNHDDRYDVQFAFKRFLRRRVRPHRVRRSGPPSGAAPPGGLPPPPAVLVLSPRNWPRLPLPREVVWAI
jgi:hypothetical protein